MFKGYRTVILNTAQALVGLGLATSWATIGLSDRSAGLIMLGLGIANVILRTLTDTALGAKE